MGDEGRHLGNGLHGMLLSNSCVGVSVLLLSV